MISRLSYCLSYQSVSQIVGHPFYHVLESTVKLIIDRYLVYLIILELNDVQ